MQIHLSGKLKHLGVPFHFDFALISPGLIPLLTKIEVVPEPFFDTHLVVILEFQMPDAPLKTLKFPMPKSFMELPLNLEFFPKGYDEAIAKKGVPTTIETWGKTIELATDKALRYTQMQNENIPFSHTQGLPKPFQGRCQPRRPKQCAMESLTRPGRPGDYNPNLEIHSHSTAKKVKQTRRLDSLCRGLKKNSADPTHQAILLQEWRAALRCQGFRGNFVKCAQTHPEIGPLPHSQHMPKHMPCTSWFGMKLQSPSNTITQFGKEKCNINAI